MKQDKSTKVDRIIQYNGLLKEEFSILLPLVIEPWKEFTLTEIKSITKKKSHHYVFEALKKFTILEVITEKKRGNTNIYAVNIENKSLDCLTTVEAVIKEKRADVPVQNIRQIMSKIKNPFYTLIVGGSYAEGKQKQSSDLDLAIIIPDSESKKMYQTALKEGELMVPEIHGYVFTKEEFYQMLINNEFNYGKELARKHLIYYGAEQYYQILFEAIKHGFKS